MQTKIYSSNKIFRPLAGILMLFVLTLTSTLVLARSVSGHEAKGLLFEIKSNSNTIYLFGSIHLAKADFYPLAPQVEQAYAQAETVAVEADVTNVEANKNAMPLMTYAMPDKLQDHLTPATWQSLQTISGPATEQFQGFKPAVVAMHLSMAVFTQQGYDPAYGVDLHFIHRAKADQKKLVELESVAFQASMMAALTDEEGDAVLKQSLEALNSGEALRDTENMIAFWKTGDANGLAKLLNEVANKIAATNKLMKLLLDDRNVAMTEKIKRLLVDGDKAFVVVGAGHLSGANSIVDLLRKQGVQVRQLP
ncbi:MAG: TraB/GumN family protein [Pseudomonadota bacterium]